jgi:ribosomal protein S9
MGMAATPAAALHCNGRIDAKGPLPAYATAATKNAVARCLDQARQRQRSPSMARPLETLRQIQFFTMLVQQPMITSQPRVREMDIECTVVVGELAVSLASWRCSSRHFACTAFETCAAPDLEGVATFLTRDSPWWNAKYGRARRALASSSQALRFHPGIQNQERPPSDLWPFFFKSTAGWELLPQVAMAFSQ